MKKIKSLPQKESKPVAQFLFSSEHFEENKLREKDLIRLEPYGISLTLDPGRPVLLLRDEKGEHNLPVALNPMEAGVTLSQSNQSSAPMTPHRFTEKLLESLHIKIERCVFVEIRGHHQYVRLFMDEHPSLGSLKIRADEAMSLCLHLKVPLYATKAFMNRSKIMNADIEELQRGLGLNPAVLVKPHIFIQ